jgi:cell division protein FtsZ
VIDDALGDEVRVTVIAAGFDGGTPKRRDAASFHRPEPARAFSASGGGRDSAAGDSDDTADTADIPTPRAGGLVGNVGNGSGGAAAEPAQPREPRRVMPSSNDDLDVPDFLK